MKRKKYIRQENERRRLLRQLIKEQKKDLFIDSKYSNYGVNRSI